jgi:hypothetical protein
MNYQAGKQVGPHVRTTGSTYTWEFLILFIEFEELWARDNMQWNRRLS